MSRTSDTRGHEHVLDLAAPPAEVWKAITAAEELVRWFPLGASTRPGKGGEIVYRWGELVGRCRILEWSPPQHLRTTWMEAPEGGTAPEFPRTASAKPTERVPVVVDWFLDGRDGGTRLRLVHSGFGRDAQWDKEFDGTNRGWEFELRALQHYLARQRGKERRATWVRRATSHGPQQVWERFSQPGALFREVALDSLGAGDRFRFVRADGEVLAGRVLVNQAPLEFAGTLESHGDGMIRFGFEDCVGQPEAHVWLATWGGSQREFEVMEARWRAALSAAFAS
jgi:uncharacterized protein YndB with AHSA1/START domain